MKGKESGVWPVWVSTRGSLDRPVEPRVYGLMRSSGWGTPLSTAILMGGGERRQAREIPGSAHERDTPTGISEPGKQNSCSLEVTKFPWKSHNLRGSGGRVLKERTLVRLC